MSQNANTLLLFFSDKTRHEHCVLALHHLVREDDEASRPFQHKLGVDFSTPWQDEWFNQQVTATPRYIRVDFDSATSAGAPYALLRALFASGLKAAVYEVFHDQVGETQGFHFMADKLVSRGDWFAAMPELTDLVVEAMGAEDEGADDADADDGATDDHDCSVAVGKPVPIQKLIDDEQRRAKEAEALVEGIVALGKAARETGANPLELAKGALVVGGLIKGVVQALVFTVVTVLLFKGVWLWIGIGVVLLVVLPLWYAGTASRELNVSGAD